MNKDSLDNLRDLVYRLKYPPTKGAYQVKVDDVMKAINKTIMEDMLAIIDQPIDIFITNDLPSLLDGGETAAMHYDLFRKNLRQAIIKKYGGSDE